jgi:hypothetical protein
MIGPGKYDDVCTRVREELGAQGVIVAVLGGPFGNGFSLQATSAEITDALPGILRNMAGQIEADRKLKMNFEGQ